MVVLARRTFYELQDVEYQEALTHGISWMISYQQSEAAKEGLRAWQERRNTALSKFVRIFLSKVGRSR